MEGHPRYTIHVSALVFELAHAHARQAGYMTTSDWLRALLWAWDEEPLEPRSRRVRHLSVRLSPPLEQRLATIAEASETSMSEAFAILVERALLVGVNNDNAVETPKRTQDARPSAATTGRADAPAIPALDDYPLWSRAILDAARATPHTFGPDRAFIAGVLEELIKRFQPDDPEAFRDMVRALLPELNRQDLVRLSRADMVAAMDPQLVRDSATRHMNATFHFVHLA
jgi:hypothetical protein